MNLRSQEEEAHTEESSPAELPVDLGAGRSVQSYRDDSSRGVETAKCPYEQPDRLDDLQCLNCDTGVSPVH